MATGGIHYNDPGPRAFLFGTLPREQMAMPPPYLLILLEAPMLRTLASRLAQSMRNGSSTSEPLRDKKPGVQAAAAIAPGRQSRLKIITAFDRGFAQIGALAAKSIAQYAAAHGYNYEVFRDIDVGRPPAWSKVHYLIAELRAGKYDYLLWVDADACFARLDRDILEEAPEGKDLSLVNQMCLRAPLADYPGMYVVCERPNTGVMLVKATDWSLQFLEKVWAQEDCIHGRWWEQTAFHKLMGYLFEITEGKEKNQLVEEVMAHIGWLDCAWNSVPTPANGVSGIPVAINAYKPMIVHFAGMKNEQRLKEMQSLEMDDASLHRG